MKALVIGGTGFVGMNVTRALLAGGHEVLATRRARGNTLFARRLGAPLLPVDLDDEMALSDTMRGRDVVFMCAGHYPRYSTNRRRELALALRGVRATLAAARRAGVQRYVLTSSVATIGPPSAGRSLSNERDSVERRSLRCVYHAVKAGIEREVLGAAADGPEVVVLCPSAIFGELDVKAGTGWLIVGVGNRSMPFYADGLANVVDADDLARAHVLAAERGKHRERYIIGGENVTVSGLLDRIARQLGVERVARRIPVRVAGWAASLAELRSRTSNGQRPCMSRELVDVVRFGRWVDNTKALTELGLGAMTPLDVTLSKACAWYGRHKYIRSSAGGLYDVTYSRAADSKRHRSDHSAHSP